MTDQNINTPLDQRLEQEDAATKGGFQDVMNSVKGAIERTGFDGLPEEIQEALTLGVRGGFIDPKDLRSPQNRADEIMDADMFFSKSLARPFVEAAKITTIPLTIGEKLVEANFPREKGRVAQRREAGSLPLSENINEGLEQLVISQEEMEDFPFLLKTQQDALSLIGFGGGAKFAMDQALGTSKVLRALSNPSMTFANKMQVLRGTNLLTRILVDSSPQRLGKAHIPAIQNALLAMTGAAGTIGNEAGGAVGRVALELVAAFGLAPSIGMLRWVANKLRTEISLTKKRAGELSRALLVKMTENDPAIFKNLTQTLADIETINSMTDARMLFKTGGGAASGNPDIKVLSAFVGEKLDPISQKAVLEFAERLKAKGGKPIEEVQEIAAQAIDDEIESLYVQLNKIENGVDNVIGPEVGGKAHQARNQLAFNQIVAVKSMAKEKEVAAWNNIGHIDIARKDYQLIDDAVSSVRREAGITDRVKAHLDDIGEKFQLRRRNLSQDLGMESTTSTTLRTLNDLEKKTTRLASDATTKEEAWLYGKIKTAMVRTRLALADNPKYPVEILTEVKAARRLTTEYYNAFDSQLARIILKKDFQGDRTNLPVTLKQFIVDNKSGRAEQVFEQFNRMFPGTAGELDIPLRKSLVNELLKKEMLKEIRALATPSEIIFKTGKKSFQRLNHKAVQKYIDNHSEMIKNHGFFDEMGDVKKAIRTVEGQIDDFIMDAKALNRSAFMQFAESETPELIIRGLIKEPLKFKAFIKRMEIIEKNQGWTKETSPIRAGMRDLTINQILNDALEIPTGAVAGIEEAVFNPTFFNDLIVKNSEIFKEVLSPEHMRLLHVLRRVINRPLQLRQGSLPDEVSGLKDAVGPSARSISSNIRMVAIGVPGTSFLLTDPAIKLGTALSKKMHRDVLENILRSPESLAEAIKLGRNEALAPTLRLLLNPTILSIQFVRQTTLEEPSIGGAAKFLQEEFTKRKRDFFNQRQAQ